MSRKSENEGFVCKNCGESVSPIERGSIRNHCPRCLYSLHVDIAMGDRANDCRGLMRPIDILAHGKKGWQILHICEKCGFSRKNKTAQDDALELIYNIVEDKIYREQA